MTKDGTFISKTLTALMSLKISGWHRAADLAGFSFGSLRTIKDRAGRRKKVGEWTLHIQCPWRITRGRWMLIGSADVFYPPTGKTKVDYDWDLGPNLRDKKLRSLLRSRMLVVVQSRLGEGGSLRLELTGNHVLEIMPDTSLPTEKWRVFGLPPNKAHLVCYGNSVRVE
jgi:hypothetical protein